jgi:hypothetical protein
MDVLSIVSTGLDPLLGLIIWIVIRRRKIKDVFHRIAVIRI